MPFYEYDCPKHGRFSVRQTMDAGREANCPECDKPADFRVSLSNFRIATSLTVVQDLGNEIDGSHRGYQVLDSKPDSGVSHKPGQPYKTAREVKVEEEISQHEAYKHKEL